ncbi:MAG: methyltransferase domain-containing protein [Sphingobacteriaceae bacterium]|nr:MAG: methyltransferase domain-containing protein [Sphingobacteriaceae bacterium]
MTHYKDYGFPNADLSHAHQYLLPALLPMLHRQNKILDLGCGNGALTIKLIELGFDVYGVDASAEGIEIAKKYYPNRFFLQDLSTGKLPEELADTVFNTIISTEVIEHLYDPEAFIQFCKAILSNSNFAELIISTPYHGYLKNLIIALFGKYDAHHSPTWSGGHIKFWSRNTLTSLLINEGFEMIIFRGCGRFPYLWKVVRIKL